MPRPRSPLRTVLEPIAIAIALAVIARGVVHIYSIPSGSMAPTLETGDQILVTRYLGAQPARGDVVVFQRDDDLLVKRVVAVPGDLIDTHLGQVRIGGRTIPEPYVLRPAATGAIESQIVPSGCYYVLGDNRDDSIDSRSWGVVPRELIIGRVRLVLWSMMSDGVARASEPGRIDAPTRRDSGRLFKWIE